MGFEKKNARFHCVLTVGGIGTAGVFDCKLESRLIIFDKRNVAGATVCMSNV